MKTIYSIHSRMQVYIVIFYNHSAHHCPYKTLQGQLPTERSKHSRINPGCRSEAVNKQSKASGEVEKREDREGSVERECDSWYRAEIVNPANVEGEATCGQNRWMMAK
jgi:hypothetical protein